MSRRSDLALTREDWLRELRIIQIRQIVYWLRPDHRSFLKQLSLANKLRAFRCVYRPTKFRFESPAAIVVVSLVNGT